MRSPGAGRGNDVPLEAIISWLQLWRVSITLAATGLILNDSDKQSSNKEG